MAEATTLPHSRFWLVWLFVFVATALTSGRNPNRGDAQQMCMAASSLLNRGSLAIAPVRNDVERAPNGRYYTKYPLLCVVQCIPALLLRNALRFLDRNDPALETWVLAIVPHALSATLLLAILQLAVALGASATTGTWLALAVLFTTPLWGAGRSLYSETLQSLLGVYIALSALRMRQASQRGAFILGGILCGLAINTKIVLAIWPVAILIDQSRERFDRQRVVNLCAYTLPGVLAGALAWVAYNQLRFGAWFAAGYNNARDGTLGFSVPLASGLYGLLLSSGKSVFAYAPILLGSLFVWSRWWRLRRRDLFLLGIPALFMLGVTARWWSWGGDWAWGPRLIFPIIPLLAMPLLDAWRTRSRAGRAALSLLAAAGFYIQVLGISVDPGVFLYDAAPIVRAVAGQHDPNTLRDGLVAVHFVPELNPIVAQHWLLTRYLSQADWNAESYYPWRSLGIPSWRPQEDPTPSRLDFWIDRNSSVAAWILEIALLLGTGVLAVLLTRDLITHRQQPSSD